MKTVIKSLIVGGLTALSLCACQKATFTVKGTVEGAQDSVLYFQQMALTGPVMLDSTRLGADGSFEFKGEATEAPEFYVLRIRDQIINLAVDSTETITVKAQYPNMAARYEVEGSDNCTKMRELALKQQVLQGQAVALEQNMGLSRQQVQDSLLRMLEGYKRDITANYIYQEPNKAYAYFALFQTIGPWLIFDPKSNPDDMKAFAAVATSWDTFYPGSERTENLHNITIEGMKNQRIVEARSLSQIDDSKIEMSGVLELNLTDNHGQRRTLTELKGKVVLLDFHAFQMDQSPQRILMLRELYNKYHEQGLEIYQVSLDQDEHQWRQATLQLPWICVRDGSGESAVKYNVQAVPEFFLIDRQNQLYKRSSQMDDAEQEIKRLLSFRAE
ncbi:MAG: AhpC/TSA family protein [Prevotella sp.]|nr:AhpC/TSA family protein [Prevotella sp.]